MGRGGRVVSDDGSRICPLCGQPEVGEVLEAVEETFDALFADQGSFPLRIELDRDLDPAPASIAVPRATLEEVEELLLGVAQVLTVLRGSVDDQALDLHALLDRLSRASTAWAGRLADL
jgi:hypothetical protein